MTNAHQKSWERLKNVPFRRLMCLFLHCHPLLDPARKTHFPYLLGGPGPPPPQVLLLGQNAPFFYGFTKPGVYDTCQKMGRSVRAALG